MLGGGFIGQMMDTMKKNRDMLGKTKRAPFDKSGYQKSGEGNPTSDAPPMPEQDRVELGRQVRLREKRDARIKLSILVVLAAMIIATGLKIILSDVERF